MLSETVIVPLKNPRIGFDIFDLVVDCAVRWGIRRYRYIVKQCSEGWIVVSLQLSIGAAFRGNSFHEVAAAQKDEDKRHDSQKFDQGRRC